MGVISFLYGIYKTPSLEKKQKAQIKETKHHIKQMVERDIKLAENNDTNFENAIFIDSIFVKQSIAQANRHFSMLKEEDLTIRDIIEKILNFTNLSNCIVFYFDTNSPSMRPLINLNFDKKIDTINNTKVKLEIIKSELVAIEISEFFLENENKFSKTVLVGDDRIYEMYLGGKGTFDNLIVFRRRSEESNMRWDFYIKYGYFEDIIAEIAKNKQVV